MLGLMPPGEAGHAYIRLTPAGPQDTIRIRAYAADPATGLVCPHQSGMISFFSVPFSGRRLLAPAPDGRVAVAWSGDYRIAIITPAGDTVRVIERAYTAEPITDDEWTTATAEYRQFQTDSPGVRCDPLGMTRPERKAALQGLYFTHEGDLVAEVTVAGGVRYDIYDGDGVTRSTVLAPTRDPSVAPHFRDGRVAQVALDDFDVQYVQVLEIGPQD